MRLGNREIPTASVRKSKIPEFKRRTLVHFTECVTTRLADDVTYFQPFDKGCEGGAGNPHDPAGHSYRTRTAYLWEEVFAWDSLLISTFKRRKLNAAIQRANFEHRVEHGGDDMSLTEALETRKALNDRLGELHTQVVDSAYERILHKEERDIVEDNELPYDDCRTRLDEARVEFRQLNRQIRAASFEVEVEYADE